MAYGKAIELFLVNGTADSLVTAELSNWNGKAIVDISREFLNSNGAEKHIDVEVPRYWMQRRKMVFFRMEFLLSFLSRKVVLIAFRFITAKIT